MNARISYEADRSFFSAIRMNFIFSSNGNRIPSVVMAFPPFHRNIKNKLYCLLSFDQRVLSAFLFCKNSIPKFFIFFKETAEERGGCQKADRQRLLCYNCSEDALNHMIVLEKL